MQLTFKGQQALEMIAVFGRKQHNGGVQRETLEFHFLADTDYEILRQIYSNVEATSEIMQEWTETIDGEEKEFSNLHLDYIIPMGLSFKPVDGEHRFVMTLGQLTEMERLQKQQEQMIIETKLALAELAEMVVNQ